MPIVKVKWVDAFSLNDQPWIPVDRLPDDIPEDAWVTTVGHLVKETPNGIWVAQGLGLDNMCCQAMFIPNVFLQIVERFD